MLVVAMMLGALVGAALTAGATRFPVEETRHFPNAIIGAVLAGVAWTAFARTVFPPIR